MTPTARTLTEMRKRGYLADVVERTMRAGFRTWKRDCFGGFDVIAVGHGELVLVQTTSAANVSSRIAKVAQLPALAALRDANVRLLVHGWAEPTKTRRTWRLREVDVS
jgi:hypothetical protein